MYWPTRWIERLAIPGRIEAKYCRKGTLSRRQLSMTERMAATFGPAYSLPAWIQFFRPSVMGRM